MITAHNMMRGGRRFGGRGSTAASVLMLAAFIVACSASVFTAEVRAESAVSVLCYHSFMEKKKMDQFSFTIDELTSQINQLKKEGFRFVSVNDVISGRITGTKNVLVTVDDGNKSVYEAYRKVFRPNGIRPLLAIYPNIIINKKHYALTWEQLTELANSCDIAAHGYFHLKINKKLLDKNPGYFKKEIFLVKKVLEEKLNRKITIFVYPFGLRDEVTIKALKEAGYRYAFTINNGRIDIPLIGSGNRPFELPRYMVTRNSWKYCFNSVMKNARHKTAYKVASAEEPSADKTDMIAMNHRPALERHDPAAELSTRLTEHMDRTALADLKAEKKEKRMKDSRGKKKIEKKTGITSDTASPAEMSSGTTADTAARDDERSRVSRTGAKGRDIFGPVSKEKTPVAAERRPAQREKLIFPGDDRVAGIAPPIQRVPNSMKRDFLDLPMMENKRASMISVDGMTNDRREQAVDESAARNEKVRSLEARVEKGSNRYVSGMKDQYHGINSKSFRTYRGFLDLVSGKIERIKHIIRKYVMIHF